MPFTKRVDLSHIDFDGIQNQRDLQKKKDDHQWRYHYECIKNEQKNVVDNLLECQQQLQDLARLQAVIQLVLHNTISKLTIHM